MAKRTCSIEGCPRPHMARGWCGTHYQNWHRCGDPLGMQIERATDCSFPECDKPHEAFGYCSAHARQLRQGKELRALRSYGGGTCKVENCPEPLVAKGYCATHWQRFHKHGDAARVDRGREGSRKYVLNEAYFDEVSTEAQAYWLGFITADGCIIESGRTHALRVDLSVRDADHLVKMCADLGSTKPLSFQRTFACISFDSWRLVESLGRLGIAPRKSASVNPWDGPERLMPHYWRGMFDGDGSIYQTTRDGIWNLSQCGSEACVRAFAAWASGICGSRAVPRHAKGGCWGWTVGGGRKPQLLAEALYGSASVSLSRKQERADQLRSTDFEALATARRLKQGISMRESWASGRHPRSKKQ